MIEKIFFLFGDIRYVALYREGRQEMRARDAADASSPESDRYEEVLWVSPSRPCRI
jgi:hypothetical protein